MRDNCRSSFHVRRKGGESPRRGFTLIEILIVISIIALLASLVLASVSIGKDQALRSAARSMVHALDVGLENYAQDEGRYPGSDLQADPDRNDVPLLFEALFGEPRPGGPGGRSAPYGRFKETDVRVWDRAQDGYRPATRLEILDPKCEKYLSDPWEQVYIYRANKGKQAQAWMRNFRGADIYSTGPDERDDTIANAERSDDLGNW
jgi:prepilin-type N-terminal cleavage/methylation domain-containing protein